MLGAAERAPQVRVTQACCSPSHPVPCWQLGMGGALDRPWVGGGPALEGLSPCSVDGRLGHLPGLPQAHVALALPCPGPCYFNEAQTRAPTGDSRPPLPTGRCRVPSAAHICEAQRFGESLATAHGCEAPGLGTPRQGQGPGASNVPVPVAPAWPASPARGDQLSLPCSRGTHVQTSWAAPMEAVAKHRNKEGEGGERRLPCSLLDPCSHHGLKTAAFAGDRGGPDGVAASHSCPRARESVKPSSRSARKTGLVSEAGWLRAEPWGTVGPERGGCLSWAASTPRPPSLPPGAGRQPCLLQAYLAVGAAAETPSSQDLQTPPQRTLGTSRTGDARMLKGKTRLRATPLRLHAAGPHANHRLPGALGALGGCRWRPAVGRPPAALAALTLLCRVCGDRPGRVLGGEPGVPGLVGRPLCLALLPASPFSPLLL